jgi:hypothetical protein
MIANVEESFFYSSRSIADMRQVCIVNPLARLERRDGGSHKGTKEVVNQANNNIHRIDKFDFQRSVYYRWVLRYALWNPWGSLLRVTYSCACYDSLSLFRGLWANA